MRRSWELGGVGLSVRVPGENRVVSPEPTVLSQAIAARGAQWIVTAVRLRGDSSVGWTQISREPGSPEVAYQEGTLIRSDHRGRGLASWIKRVNLVRLRTEYPEVRRIPTWTNGENTAVIAMNVRLGFVSKLVSVVWEKTLVS